ncbi:helix-turn-helix transcriptional regulator [Fictibacillus sp. 7GRE50]|uniref:helix-turn-helix domain-containing protein n=1 Tax=unclassified Fictibacillus TaxID=2644029 RepID=UPI0018CD7B42|nr:MULTISPECIES: helix-turn-helix transcriptional regulator [unclassified Fictibacillus]MBH0161807.1 helix-turn-helix transcriptional regulator [Fictibacillus sp. 26RED30]MBH0164180.1 helix-turn-helix transcriptional regulator [Fictibacillus sp. 7GRE50]
MNLGEKIRYFRKVKNLSQQELAVGICSVPYLSKIENGVTEPSEEIQQHLAERLAIRLHTKNEKSIMQNYVDLFYSLYMRDYSTAKQKYDNLIDLPSQSVEEDILNKIFKSMYIMMTTQEIDGVPEMLDEVGYIDDVIKGEKAFYYLLARSQLSFFMEEFEDSHSYALKAEKLLEEHRFQEWERGYLLYMIGLTANQLFKSITALEYTQSALTIFEKTYFFKRCADCRIILAIVQTRIKNFDESIKQLLLAETIANSFGDEVIKGIVYHNLGSIANHKGETEKAIELFSRSLQAKESEPFIAKVMTIYALIKSYEKTNQPEKGLQLLNTWMDHVKDNPIFRGYELHFLYHKELFTHGELNDSTVQFMIKEMIPYFRKRNEWIFLAEYYPILGKYFEDHQKYKQASMYYSSAMEAMRKMYDLGVTYI